MRNHEYRSVIFSFDNSYITRKYCNGELDKIHARSKGPVQNLTRQAMDGRANFGGLRIGQMENDCLVAHGISKFLYDKMFLSSDAFYVIIYENNETKIKFCNVCNNFSNFSEISLPYSTKLFFYELISMGIMPKINF